MGYSASGFLVSSDNTLQEIPVNTITFFIAICSAVFSVIAFGVYTYIHGVFMGLAVYATLLVCSLLLIYGHQKQKPHYYLPYIVFQLPLLLVSLVLTTYGEFIHMFFTDEEFKEKVIITLKSIGVGFLDVVQLYFVYIVYCGYNWLKGDLIRQQRMERIENDEQMSVYP